MTKPPQSEEEGALPGRAAAVLGAELQSPLAPALYLVATPIGNLADITLRALAVLARADLVFCEDTRHSRKLFSHFGIKRELAPYHEHNAARERPRILARLRAGFSVALVADAGTPLVSDPGFKLARAAREEGLEVIAIPGPAAPIAALTSSGLPSDRFFFEGFLPAKREARRKRIEALADIPASLVLFEAANRVEATLADLAAVLGERQGAVAKELTKRHERVVTAPLGTLAKAIAAWPEEARKGEFVIVVAPPARREASRAEIEERLAAALKGASVRDAARAVAAELGAPRGQVYKIAIELSGGGEGKGA